jgi:ATP-dependent DNA ligase
MYQWDMAGLGEYRRKRAVGRTPEPIPAEDALPHGDDDTFVIQEHHARSLHWDVRLERGGVLVSWAVPKGLPTEPGDIRLAVHTEDHPMEYASFEGEIPRGEYGGGLEGVVAKRLTSRYVPGRRSPEWIKIANIRALEVVVGGWRPGDGKRSDVFGSLMLGLPSADGLRYVGLVGTGFSEEVLRMLMGELKAIARTTSPFCNEVPRDKARGARWVEPTLVGEVVFRNWTGDDKLRAAAWRGLRADKRPEDVERWDPDGR